MIRRKETDGERIADKAFIDIFGYASQREEKKRLSDSIDRIIRKRMAEAWKEGWSAASWYNKHECDNPYRGRRRK